MYTNEDTHQSCMVLYCYYHNIVHEYESNLLPTGSSEEYIGQHEFTNDSPPSQTNKQFIFPNAVINNAGQLIGWRFLASGSDDVYFQIWRLADSATSTYELIGQNMMTGFSPGDQYIEISQIEMFEVKVGDVIGMHQNSMLILFKYWYLWRYWCKNKIIITSNNNDDDDNNDSDGRRRLYR